MTNEATELAELKNEIKAMTHSINECVIAITKKEMSDHYLAESLKEEKLKNVEQDNRLRQLELSDSGDIALRKIFWIAITTLITIISSAVIYQVVIK